MIIDLNIEDHRWNTLDLQRLAEQVAQETLSHLGIDVSGCEISLLACDDARITGLNAGFRSRDSATNVLSWPASDLASPQDGTIPAHPHPDFTGDLTLGDIAIAWETCTGEAQEFGRPLQDHITHLLVHGVLHLLGYDHIRDMDATLMMEKEVEILGKMGVGNPY